MESKTKNKQEWGTLLKMAKRAFPGERGTEKEYTFRELKEGFFNAAYLVCFPSGKEAILKIAPPKDAQIMTYEHGMMRTEVEAMRLVRAKTAVPVPEIFYYDPSGELCGSDYFFMEKLKGASYASTREKLSSEERYRVEYEAGRYNRLMNELEGEYFGIPGVPAQCGKSWKAAFGKIMEALLKDGEQKKMDIGMDYDELRRILEKHAGCLEEVKHPRFVHWDLWEGNLFQKDGRVTGLIDFERALWGDPLMEHDFQGITRGEKNTPFLEGYGKTSFSSLEKEQRGLYNLHLFFIMTIECAYREYEDNSQYRWARRMLLEEKKILE